MSKNYGKIKWINESYATICDSRGKKRMVKVSEMCHTSRKKQKKIVALIERFEQGIDDELSVGELKEILHEVLNIKVSHGDPASEMGMMLSAYEFDLTHKKK